MPKNKKKDKAAGPSAPWFHPTRDMPSDKCKQFLIELIVKFYEDNTLRALDSKYVRYCDEGPENFQRDITQIMMDALHTPEWMEETHKPGYMKFLENRAHDALWNCKDMLTKYGRLHREGDAAFADVVLKADLFETLMRPFAKNRNRQGSVGWWNSHEGRSNVRLLTSHLIALPSTAIVTEVNNVVKRGGFATIRKVRIEGGPGIERFWEFAAKRSNQWQRRPDLARLEHQNESMAVAISHPGVIKFVAIHSSKYEGYAFWWNGGTLRDMLERDRDYGDNVYVHLEFGRYPDDEIVRALQLVRFRKVRTELAWALIHIMNEVHKTGNLHNDLSPDNILLHFPRDESRVYIGVCDWGLTTKMAEPKKSVYTFTNVETMLETLQRRWWVDPRVAYVHRHGADVELIPTLSKSSEEFATARIAQRINGRTMSNRYQQLQRESASSVVFSNQEFANTFHMYMDRLCSAGREGAGGLSHIITRFSATYHWPTPYEHFRTTYD